MYEDTKFKIIDRMPERDVIHYIWTRIVALAGKVNLEGNLYMSKNIPYRIDTLSIEFNRDVNQVKLALDAFIKLEIVEVTEDNIYKVKNFSKHQNIKVKSKDKEDTHLKCEETKIKEAVENKNLENKEKETVNNSNKKQEENIENSINDRNGDLEFINIDVKRNDTIIGKVNNDLQSAPILLEKKKRKKSNKRGRKDTDSKKESEYYEVITTSRSEKLILEPNKLRIFLEAIDNRKIKFKFENIEFTVPILHKDMPITFNLKEDNELMVLSTHKQLPIPLNSNNDVYFFKNELYLPSKNQSDNYVTFHEKLKAQGKIVYRKDMQNYIKLILILSSITENINIAERLRSFVSDSLKTEFLVFEDDGKIYCDAILNYGSRKVNILNKNSREDKFIMDCIKEEKLFLEMEKRNFIKMNNRFMFTGGDEEVFNLLRGIEDSIQALGKITLGNGLNDKKIYDSEYIKANLFERDGKYDFSYNIGNLEINELNSAFKSYRNKTKFYKTKNNNFLDFEDEKVRVFFNLFKVLNINKDAVDGRFKVETSKVL